MKLSVAQSCCIGLTMKLNICVQEYQKLKQTFKENKNSLSTAKLQELLSQLKQKKLEIKEIKTKIKKLNYF